jgi:hypothetical protein
MTVIGIQPLQWKVAMSVAIILALLQGKAHACQGESTTFHIPQLTHTQQ